MNIRKIEFDIHGDSRGKLVALEENRDIPFEIKRVYYMFDTIHNVIRGEHAHKSLEQVLICVHGSCKLLLNNGFENEEIILNNPGEGIYISTNIWREICDFEEGTVVMVVASDYYKEDDYIRDYDDYIAFVNGSSGTSE